MSAKYEFVVVSLLQEYEGALMEDDWDEDPESLNEIRRTVVRTFRQFARDAERYRLVRMDALQGGKRGVASLLANGSCRTAKEVDRNLDEILGKFREEISGED